MPYEIVRLKPPLVPYLGKPVGLLAFSLSLFLFSQSDILAVMLSAMSPVPVISAPQAFQGLFSILSLASLLMGAVACISFLIAAAYRNANTYMLTPNGIIIHRSFISRIRREIPYSRISDVTVEQTLLGRIFRYGDIIPVSISGFGIIGQERYAAERRLDQLDSVSNPYHVAQLIMDQVEEHAAPLEDEGRSERKPRRENDAN
jgi:uncharacterized membrane protein YdbT with pleckstrin-like domain